MKKTFFVIVYIFCTNFLFSQTLRLLTSGTKTSLRGLSVVSNKIIWASGSNGTVAKSTDAGITWKWITVKGFEKNDFRDIEAFDAKTAIIMAVAEPAYILKTTDGGENWKVLYKNETKGIFLDAIEFWNEQSGIAIGDPIKNKFFITRTFDGGKTWQDLPGDKLPLADSGEACFASSGTNVVKLNNAEAVFVSGGLSSHIYIRDKKIILPILQGLESTGANSVAVKNSKTIMVVGGDFNTKDSSNKICYYTNDAGITWQEPIKKPNGYRSCVEYLGKNKWITCGINGADISYDNGKNFTAISNEGFNVCKKAKKGQNVFFAGSNGKIFLMNKK